MLAQRPRASLGIAALAVALALGCTLIVNDLREPPSPSAPRILMPLGALRMFLPDAGAAPAPAPPSLPNDGKLCFAASEPCSAIACTRFAAARPNPPAPDVCGSARPKPRFHRIAVPSR